MAAVAAEYFRRENPMNGDGSNTTVDAIVAALNMLDAKSPVEREEQIQRYTDRISERTRRAGLFPSHEDLIRKFGRGAIRVEVFKDPWYIEFTYADGSRLQADGLGNIMRTYPAGTLFPAV